jgi:hypothetical protein
MLVVRTLMKPQRYAHVSLRVAFVAILPLALLMLGMAVTPSVSASANQSPPSSQSPGQAQVRINATVTAVLNLGNAAPVLGAGHLDSNGTEAVAPNAVPSPANVCAARTELRMS